MYMMFLSKASRALGFALAVFAVVFWSADAEADRSAPIPLDVQLLDADCGVRARVAALEPVGDVSSSPTVYRVELAVIDVLWCRWPWTGQRPQAFTVSGRLDPSPHPDRSSPPTLRIPHRGTLELGAEYVLLLGGGTYRYAPIMPDAIWRVGAGGIVECGGGAIYGLTSYGVRCSWSGAEASAPLTAEELGRELAAARQNAALRRPELARDYEAMQRALTPGEHDAR